jgi:type IV secretory pathway protease TraF
MVVEGPRWRKYSVAILLTLIFWLSYQVTEHLVVATTDSLDRTVFWKTDQVPDKGNYGLFTFPPHPYLTAKDIQGQIFAKKVACVSGDMLQRIGQDLFCNGRFLATLRSVDSQGDSLPDPNISGSIPSGMAFMLGTSPLSGDSRYFGLVPLDSITKVIPLW